MSLYAGRYKSERRAILESLSREIGETCGLSIPDGMVACAVPVRDADDRFIASLFTHAPVICCSLEDLCGFEPQLRKAARELEDVIDVPEPG